MAILFYQIGIFLLIQIAAVFGKNARNTAIILISIFTILQVFMSWLLILQFITIFVSYAISKSWLNEKAVSKQTNSPNYVPYSFKEKGMRSITMVDLNDKNIDETVRGRAELQNRIGEESNRRYNEDPEYKSSIDAVINKMVSGSLQPNRSKNNEINLSTKFYYIEHSKTYGPISAKKLIHLVNRNQINKNSYIRQETEKVFNKRVIDVVKLYS